MRKVCIALLKTKSLKESFSTQDGASCRGVMFLISFLPQRQKKYQIKFVLKYACVYMGDGRHRPRRSSLTVPVGCSPISESSEKARLDEKESEWRTRSASYLA